MKKLHIALGIGFLFVMGVFMAIGATKQVNVDVNVPDTLDTTTKEGANAEVQKLVDIGITQQETEKLNTARTELRAAYFRCVNSDNTEQINKCTEAINNSMTK